LTDLAVPARETCRSLGPLAAGRSAAASPALGSRQVDLNQLCITSSLAPVVRSTARILPGDNEAPTLANAECSAPARTTAFGQKAAERTPSAPATCASTKAGVGPGFISDVLFARCASHAGHSGEAERERPRNRANAACRSQDGDARGSEIAGPRRPLPPVGCLRQSRRSVLLCRGRGERSQAWGRRVDFGPRRSCRG
jgi:hypothetical protein